MVAQQALCSAQSAELSEPTCRWQRTISACRKMSGPASVALLYRVHVLCMVPTRQERKPLQACRSTQVRGWGLRCCASPFQAAQLVHDSKRTGSHAMSAVGYDISCFPSETVWTFRYSSSSFRCISKSSIRSRLSFCCSRSRRTPACMA